MAPGSGGGLGPGLNKAPQAFVNATTKAAHFGIYMRLGHELAFGEEFTWEYKKCGNVLTGNASSRTSRRPSVHQATPGLSKRCLSQVERWRMPVLPTKFASRQCIVCLQIDWTIIPRKKLRRLDMLESAVADVDAAAQWLLTRYPGRPLVLIGFSFGGPAMWAATRRLPSEALVAGAVSVAGSARGGSAFEKRQLDTVGALKEWGRRRLAGRSNAAPGAMFLHGTHDERVALQVGEYLYEQASKPRRLVRVNLGNHMLNKTRDVAYNELRSWIIGAFGHWHLHCNPNASAPMASQFGRFLDSGEISVGQVVPSHPGDSPGHEHWRVKPNEVRCRRTKSAGHPLAGLVGYSALWSHSDDEEGELCT